MLRKIIVKFLPFAFMATVLCGLVYVAVQQSLRMGANDPQIQIAEDAAAALQMGSFMNAVVPTSTVVFSESLSPYVVVYDHAGNPIVGNGILDDNLPKLPAGIFTYTQNVGEDRFTWQPRPGVRQAVVVVRVNNSSAGFVMAGRSLREVEVREDQVEWEAGLAWIFILVGLFVFQAILSLVEPREKKK